MTDNEFNEISQTLVKDSGDLPYVLIMHDEQTRELRLSSNLTVESLQMMLTQALSKADSLERRSAGTVRDNKH